MVIEHSICWATGFLHKWAWLGSCLLLGLGLKCSSGLAALSRPNGAAPCHQCLCVCLSCSLSLPFFFSRCLCVSRRIIVSRPYVASHLNGSYKTASLFASVFWSSAMAIEMRMAIGNGNGDWVWQWPWQWPWEWAKGMDICRHFGH